MVARSRVLPAATQSAVSLTSIDGESISGTSQSNLTGNGYYTRKGFTRASGWTGPNPLGGDFTGFDDPNFLIVSAWLIDFSGTGFYSRMDDLGLNAMMPAAGSVSLANNVTFGKSAVVTSDVWAGGTISTADDPGVVGVSSGEEPSTVAQFDATVAANDSWLASSDGPGRMSFYNFADPILNGSLENVVFPVDMATSADIISCDQYWFAGAVDNAGSTQQKLHFRLYGFEGNATTAQCARGSHYGSMMDCIRKHYTLSTSRPFWVWIENGAPYDTSTSQAITPAQMKWAVWSTLVHGARAIGYFNHTFRAGDPGGSSNNFNTDFYGGPGVTGTGIYAAAKEVNLRALQIAPVLNAPFDGYFVFGDFSVVETVGFLTAVTSTNARSAYGGVDASCKWYPAQSKHYILSTTREVDGATSIPATYRMVDQGQTTAFEVFENRSVSITRGGGIPGGFCEFTDPFTTAASYHCYRID